MCITNLKPDIVIVDKMKENLHIFELTCPLERNIDEWHKYKQKNMYIFVQASQVSTQL